jgi:hypothetical protein
LASRISDQPAPEGRHPSSAHSEFSDNFDDIGALNAQAERCRRLAGAMYNREVSEILGSMADGFERTAAEISKSRQL